MSQERVEWDTFCEQLQKKLRKAGLEKGFEAVKERFGHAGTTPRRGLDAITSLEDSLQAMLISSLLSALKMTHEETKSQWDNILENT